MKVAMIGSGVAGKRAAQFLARSGGPAKSILITKEKFPCLTPRGLFRDLFLRKFLKEGSYRIHRRLYPGRG